MRHITTFSFSLLFALLATVASSQRTQLSADIVTDRPDQTESSETIQPGMVQIESGWLQEDVDGATGSPASRSKSTLGTLVRIGLFDQVELRVGWQGLVDTKVGQSRTNGSGDGELGIKWHLWAEHGRRPDAAVLVGTSVPMGSSMLTTDAWDPAFRFAFSHQLSSSVGLAYNIGYGWETEPAGNGGSDRVGAAIWTIATGFRITEKLGTFVEFFGAVPTDRDSQSSVDGGFTWLVRPNFQLDLYGGVGLSSTATDSFVGFGFSWRLPR